MNTITHPVPTDQVQPLRVFLEFLEAIDSMELRYLSCDLLDILGLEDRHELEPAIERALNACMALSIPTRKHFRRVFIIRTNGIYRGWKLSALGCYLTLINEDPSNRMIANFQRIHF